MERPEVKTKKEEILKCGYEPGRKIGAGTYGAVYLATGRDGKQYAIKIFSDSKYNGYGHFDTIEITCLMRLRHPHIIHGIEVLTANKCGIKDSAIVLPLATISSETVIILDLPMNQKLSILYKLVHGIAFLHQNQILHLDIKLQNLVFNYEKGIYQPKLIDYGLAMYDIDFAENIQPRITDGYRAPEQITTENQEFYHYHKYSDIWSLGVMFVELIAEDNFMKTDPRVKAFIAESGESDLHLDMLFDDGEDKRLFLLRILDKYLKSSYPDLKDLISGMLEVDPKFRSTIETCLSHRVFDNVRTEIESYIDYNDIVGTKTDYYRREDITFFVKLAERRELSLQHVFMMLDIYFKVAACLPEKYRPLNQYLEAACYYLPYKILYGKDYLIKDIWHDSLFPGSKFDYSEYYNIESYIINILRGILDDNYLYKICKNNKQLELSFNKIILNLDMTVYNNLDYEAWSKKLDRLCGNNIEDTSKLTIFNINI